MAKKLILVLESSTDKTTVALGLDGQLLSQEEVISTRYSEKIIFLIEDLLKANSCTLGDLFGFGVGLGPGSFTGTRAGISTSRALGQALRKPVAGISSMDAVAWAVIKENQAGRDQNIFVALDARRGEVFGCNYKHQNGGLLKGDCRLMALEDFETFARNKIDMIFAGTALNLVKEEIETAAHHLWVPQARYLLEPVNEVIGDSSWENIFGLLPLYWRPSDAKPMSKRERP